MKLILATLVVYTLMIRGFVDLSVIQWIDRLPASVIGIAIAACATLLAVFLI